VSFSDTFVVFDKAIHDRKDFDCGESELNDFIQTKASKHMEAKISRTMVLPSKDPLPNGKYRICAFYAVTPSSIERDSLPEDVKKKLPSYPVPVFLLAQLAVHSEYRNQKLGKTTLLKSLEYLWKIAGNLSAFAIVVDCLNENAQNFYIKYGFQPLKTPNVRTRMFISMIVIDKLASDLGWERR